MNTINGDFEKSFLQFISHPGPRNPQMRKEVSTQMASQRKRIGKQRRQAHIQIAFKGGRIVSANTASCSSKLTQLLDRQVRLKTYMVNSATSKLLLYPAMASDEVARGTRGP